MMRPPLEIDRMFHAGTRYAWEDGRHSFIDVQHVGDLKLATGKLIAQDPAWPVPRGVQPFTVTVPPGRYPVTLSISQWDESPTRGYPSPMRSVNAAKLSVSDEPVVSWELALQPGQEVERMEGDEFFGFGVDGGVACFLDASARGQLHQMQFDQQLWSDVGAVIFKDAGVELATDDVDLNIILFACGMGDGAYATWIGRAANQDPVCFVCDLELLDHSLGPVSH